MVGYVPPPPSIIPYHSDRPGRPTMPDPSTNTCLTPRQMHAGMKRTGFVSYVPSKEYGCSPRGFSIHPSFMGTWSP